MCIAAIGLLVDVPTLRRYRQRVAAPDGAYCEIWLRRYRELTTSIDYAHSI